MEIPLDRNRLLSGLVLHTPKSSDIHFEMSVISDRGLVTDTLRIINTGFTAGQSLRKGVQERPRIVTLRSLIAGITTNASAADHSAAEHKDTSLTAHKPADPELNARYVPPAVEPAAPAVARLSVEPVTVPLRVTLGSRTTPEEPQSTPRASAPSPLPGQETQPVRIHQPSTPQPSVKPPQPLSRMQLKPRDVVTRLLRGPAKLEMKLLISKDGRVTDVVYPSTTGVNVYILKSAAKASKGWRFRAAEVNGQPVAGEFIVQSQVSIHRL